MSASARTAIARPPRDDQYASIGCVQELLTGMYVARDSVRTAANKESATIAAVRPPHRGETNQNRNDEEDGRRQVTRLCRRRPATWGSRGESTDHDQSSDDRSAKSPSHPTVKS
jgi:hypothetical protein